MLQASSNEPPVPKADPAPPVGDVVPIDDHIWILMLVAIVIVLWTAYNSKRIKPAN